VKRQDLVRHLVAHDPHGRWFLERLDPYLRPELGMKNKPI